MLHNTREYLSAQMESRFTGSVYSEVDAFSSLLGYKTANAGCCKVCSFVQRIMFIIAHYFHCAHWNAHVRLPCPFPHFWSVWICFLFRGSITLCPRPILKLIYYGELLSFPVCKGAPYSLADSHQGCGCTHCKDLQLALSIACPPVIGLLVKQCLA